jgi:hypothetical protein
LPAPLGGAPFHPRLSTRTLRHASSPARAAPSRPHADASLPELCTLAVAYRRLHLCVTLGTMLTSAPSHHNPMGYLSLEQFHECGALPNRFSRAPHSWKVSSRGGVAAGVSGGREDGAAGGTGQGGADWYRSGGSRLVLAGRRSASCRARRRMGRSATLKTPRLAWGNVKSRPFGESYRTVRWAGSRGYEPGSGRGRACMATLELRILRRFAWSCG